MHSEIRTGFNTKLVHKSKAVKPRRHKGFLSLEVIENRNRTKEEKSGGHYTANDIAFKHELEGILTKNGKCDTESQRRIEIAKDTFEMIRALTDRKKC